MAMKALSKRFVFTLLVLILMLIPISNSQAQNLESLELRLVKKFGFQSGLRIQGAFRLRAVGPDNLNRVTFYLDDEPIGSDNQAPFRIDFNTGDFTAGEHNLWAEGEVSTGAILRSKERRLIFLTAEQGLGAVSQFLLPIFILIGAGILFSYLVMVRGGRKDSFRLGEYGPAGGAVCRRCGMPFSRHFMAPNLLVGKLERCPHCKHLAIVPRASAAALDQAEAKYKADRDAGSYQLSEKDDDWEQRIEDTRFES